MPSQGRMKKQESSSEYRLINRTCEGNRCNLVVGGRLLFQGTKVMRPDQDPQTPLLSQSTLQPKLEASVVTTFRFNTTPIHKPSRRNQLILPPWRISTYNGCDAGSGDQPQCGPQHLSITTIWIELSRVHLWGLQVGTTTPQEGSTVILASQHHPPPSTTQLSPAYLPVHQHFFLLCLRSPTRIFPSQPQPVAAPLCCFRYVLHCAVQLLTTESDVSEKPGCRVCHKSSTTHLHWVNPDSPSSLFRFSS
ncbi:UNVERIFIED_CONTAM: hypothetical protein FKN15_050695 [Acipenser sinensis]